jgi:hypothetical protein
MVLCGVMPMRGAVHGQIVISFGRKGSQPDRTATMSHRGGYNRINVTSWRLLTQAWRDGSFL